jgi:hypothetical protein
MKNTRYFVVEYNLSLKRHSRTMDRVYPDYYDAIEAAREKLASASSQAIAAGYTWRVETDNGEILWGLR